MNYTVSITSKGQMTIPKEIRDGLGLRAPSKVSIMAKKDGSLLISQPKTIEEIREQLRINRGKGEPLSEREKVVGEYLLAEDEKTKL